MCGRRLACNDTAATATLVLACPTPVACEAAEVRSRALRNIHTRLTRCSVPVRCRRPLLHRPAWCRHLLQGTVAAAVLLSAWSVARLRFLPSFVTSIPSHPIHPSSDVAACASLDACRKDDEGRPHARAHTHMHLRGHTRCMRCCSRFGVDGAMSC